MLEEDAEVLWRDKGAVKCILKSVKKKVLWKSLIRRKYKWLGNLIMTFSYSHMTAVLESKINGRKYRERPRKMFLGQAVVKMALW